MIDIRELIEWRRSEVRHINSTLERGSFKSREKTRWRYRRAGHERTIQALETLEAMRRGDGTDAV